MTLTLSPLAVRFQAIFAMVATTLFVAVAVFAHSPALVGASSSSPAPQTLAQIAQAEPTHNVSVIVRFADRVRWERGPQTLAMYGGKVTRDLHIINGYGVRMSAGSAMRLSHAPGIVGVDLNSAVTPSGDVGPDSAANQWGAKDCDTGVISWLATSVCSVHTSYLQSTRVTKFWKDNDPIGGGKGITVAVVDTGIAGDLPDFRTSPTDSTSRVIASVRTNPDATTEGDGYGHGTHVAGLIAGNGSLRDAGDPLRGQYIGAAPRANLVNIKVSDDHGATSLIDVIYGVQFAVDHQADYGIRVINLSLNSDVAESYKTDPVDAAVESAWLHGIVVVAAAGNRGTDADAVDYAPGNDPYVITVGSVDDQGTKRTSDDKLTDWSSRGTTQDGFDKPDVVAPGAHIVAPYAPGSDFGTLCPSCIVDGQYFKVGGTSMSTAIVSGLVADLLEAHPTWTPDQVKGAVTQNLRHIVGQNDEVDNQHADDASKPDLKAANNGLTPNDLIDPATGDIDYTRASWSRASWSASPTRASWSRASWSRASWSRASWSATLESCSDMERASWSRASWSRASWSRASWSRASWSADGMSTPDLSADDLAAIDAEIAAAKADCATLLASMESSRASWSRASWSRASWSRASWSSSFTK